MDASRYSAHDAFHSAEASGYRASPSPRERHARTSGSMMLSPLATPTSPMQAPPASPFRRKPLPQGASPLAQGASPLAMRPASGERFGSETRMVRDPAHSVDREPDRFSDIDLSESASSMIGGPQPRPHPQRPPDARHAGGPPRQGQDPYHARLTGEPNGVDRNRPYDSHQGSHADRGANVGRSRSTTTTAHRSPQSQPLKLQVDDPHRDGPSFSDGSMYSGPTSKPRSPTSNLPSIFEGRRSSAGALSSVTTFSSPSSPRSPKFPSAVTSTPPRPVPSTVDVRRPNTSSPFASSLRNEMDVPISDPAFVEHVDALEEELRDISSELAASIRREIELEDLVDQLRVEAGENGERGRRTSDYFSDEGTSSTRDGDAKEMDFQKLQRKAEQGQAQLRLRLTQRIQTERLRRKALETQVRKLDQLAQQSFEPRNLSDEAAGRVKRLEVTLEETRRRLREERHMKENYEDLLTALRAEIEEHRNERDNIREEVVPRMRAHIKGLESEASELQTLRYEHSRIQQELQLLRESQTDLFAQPRRRSIGAVQPSPTFDMIAEESSSPPARSGPLNPPPLAPRPSIAGTPTGARHPRRSSLTRSSSLRERESRDSLADRVKDIEAQRDALHQALKSLLDRHEYQNREHTKRIKALEMERDRALSGATRKGYDREVSNLRDEINHLRRRADDALEQKWQCEKGLGGLKKDLDRAEQETSSLRTLLHEHDILVPDQSAAGSASASASEARMRSGSISSASLEKAYRELQATHSLALARIQALERGDHGTPTLAEANAETQRTMQLLKMSISNAEAERDAAQRQAEQFRLQAESLREAGKDHASDEMSLSEQLQASAARVEELAVQVRQQLESNNQLRNRLAEAIARGERQQKASAARITEMQGKLKSLEDQLTVAQQHTEETVAKHEDEVRQMRENHNTHLQRLPTTGVRMSGTASNFLMLPQHAAGAYGRSLYSPPPPFSLASSPRKGSVATSTGGGPPAGLSPSTGIPLPLSLSSSSSSNATAIAKRTSIFSVRSPRLDMTSSGAGMSMMELSKTEDLEGRVEDLERALSDADREMGEVVSRMNMAQIEVMELQSQRDEAMRQTKKLQLDVDRERQKVYTLIR